MRARDIMTKAVITVTPSTPIQDVVQIMLERRISGLPVVDATGNLVGIITEADLLIKEADPKPGVPVMNWFGGSLWLERWVSGHRKLEGRTAGEVMTHNIVTAEESTPVHELANRMMQQQVKRLPIVRDRQLVGIVTRADILKVFLRQDDALARDAHRIADEFRLAGEELRMMAYRGVIVVSGRITVGRRNALLHRLWEIDGIIGIDDRDLSYTAPASAHFKE